MNFIFLLNFLYHGCHESLLMCFCLFNIGCREGMNGVPQGMKSYAIQLNRFSYYEHLQIDHFFDIMHIGKNVT